MQIQCVTDALGVATFTPAFVNTPMNAFYIIDSPYGIKLQTSVIGTQTYFMQTGESVPQPLGNINFQGLASPDARNVNSAGNAYTLITSTSFYFKIWLGTDSHLGFIDHRSIANPCSVETLIPTQANTGFSIAAGAAPQTVLYGTGLSALSSGFYDIAMLISNTDSNNTVYLTSAFASSYIMPLFPQQVYRVPLLLGSQIPGGSANQFYVANPNATAVIIMVGRICQNNSIGIESNN